MTSAVRKQAFPVRDYDLGATFTSGQAFRWQRQGEGWIGVIGNRWVRLHVDLCSIVAETTEPTADWGWLADYLQVHLDLGAVLQTFPQDEPMLAAVAASRGLRLLRQDPWECLASFILSSTKQITQIQQIIALLCDRYGEAVAVPPAHASIRAFPSPARLAELSEAEFRACKMGFRAPFLRATARSIAAGRFDLRRLQGMPLEAARAELMTLPGVGPKIADCVLLFAYGCSQAFPVDVWVAKALRELYFPRRRVRPAVLREFASAHFGPNGGYAQQYLFHYMRSTRPRRDGRLQDRPA